MEKEAWDITLAEKSGEESTLFKNERRSFFDSSVNENSSALLDVGFESKWFMKSIDIPNSRASSTQYSI